MTEADIITELRATTSGYKSLGYREVVASIKLLDAAADTIEAALREKAERENPKPLTLEQVKARKWVWIGNDTACRNQGWAKVFAMYDLAKLEVIQYSFKNYGKTWIAYAHEPKGVEQ